MVEDAVAELLTERESLPDTVADMDCEVELVPVKEYDEVRVCVADGEAVAEPESEKDHDFVGLTLTVVLCVSLPDTEPE